MLPLCERSTSVSRTGTPKFWRHSYPIGKQPNTIGEHLRKKRFELGLKQSQAAREMQVSKLTLSLWETDKVYPKWAQQPKITTFLGYDPFTNPALGAPPSNKPIGVAILSPNSPISLGQAIRAERIKQRKTCKMFAAELGVSVKTLWLWEADRNAPSKQTILKIFL